MSWRSFLILFLLLFILSPRWAFILCGFLLAYLIMRGIAHLITVFMTDEEDFIPEKKEAIADALRPGFSAFQDAKHRKAEEKLEEMEDEDLHDWVRKHPKDALAQWKWSERMRENGDLEGYVRERERFLLMDSGLEVSEKSTLFHQLADFCLNELRQPERARQVLRAFTLACPDAKEADPTQERIRRIEVQMAQTAASEPSHPKENC